MDIENHTFLVTGASSGLGAACARHLVARDARVVLADIDVGHGESLAGELGGESEFIATDVTDESSVEAAIATAKRRFGPIHGAVNCAGVLGACRVAGRDRPHDLSAFARVIEVNLIGTFNVVRLVAASIATGEPEEDGERGVIINTSSVAAYDGQIGQAAYAASKAGVAGMTLPIARELAGRGIRVIAVAPGVFNTPMMANVSDEVRQSLADQIPFPHRLGEPLEYARLVAHLIENRMINGSVVRIDGALRMAAK